MKENNPDNEDFIFSVNELQVLLLKLKRLALPDSKALEDHNQQWEYFYKSTLKENKIDDDAYLLLSKKTIGELIPFVAQENVVPIILDFSRTNCTIQDIYEELNLTSFLINYIGTNEYEVTDYNKVFLGDYLYSYFYNKSYSLMSNNEFENLLILLKTDSILIHSGQADWIIKSIFSTFLDFKLFSQDQLKSLLEHFDPSLTSKVKKHIAG